MPGFSIFVLSPSRFIVRADSRVEALMIAKTCAALGWEGRVVDRRRAVTIRIF